MHYSTTEFHKSTRPEFSLGVTQSGEHWQLIPNCFHFILHFYSSFILFHMILYSLHSLLSTYFVLPSTKHSHPTYCYIQRSIFEFVTKSCRELVASREGNSKWKLAHGSTLRVWKRCSAATPLIILKSAKLSRAIAVHDKGQSFCWAWSGYKLWYQRGQEGDPCIRPRILNAIPGSKRQSTRLLGHFLCCSSQRWW